MLYDSVEAYLLDVICFFTVHRLYCVMCDQEEPQGEEEPASSSLWAVLFNAHLTENSQVCS